MLAEEAHLDEFVQIACLPDSKQYNFPSEFNVSAIAVGWGLLNEFDDFQPLKMHNVQLTIYNDSMCSQVAPTYIKDWSKQICAGKRNMLNVL